MNPQLEKDLKDTMDIISANWKMQNNYYDKESNFIYKVGSLDECLIEIERTGINKEYALHRWYNYMTSIQCEYIFCEYGAVHEKDKYNHDVIRWYYANQSQQSRKQMLNRLYVVCDAPSSHENMVMKSNFDLMRQRISTYMKYAKENGVNELVITDAGKDYRLKSDIVRLK